LPAQSYSLQFAGQVNEISFFESFLDIVCTFCFSLGFCHNNIPSNLPGKLMKFHFLKTGKLSGCCLYFLLFTGFLS